MGCNVQVLVAAMNQENHGLLERLNIQSDVIVGNQCQCNEVERFIWNGHEAVFLNFAEKGVGLNRNNCLMRATGDICLFADDDMRYVDDYPRIVEECFREHPEADVIIFNLIEPKTKRYVIQKAHKVGWLCFLRYGAVRIAVRRQRIVEQGIFFNLCFGGGTEHSCGEDSLFLADCLKHGLRMVAVPVFLAELTEERDSTWFKGYTDKYFRDKGFFYEIMAPKFKRFLCLQDAIRHRREYGRPWRELYRLMMDK